MNEARNRNVFFLSFCFVFISIEVPANEFAAAM